MDMAQVERHVARRSRAVSQMLWRVAVQLLRRITTIKGDALRSVLLSFQVVSALLLAITLFTHGLTHEREEVTLSFLFPFVNVFHPNHPKPSIHVVSYMCVYVAGLIRRPERDLLFDSHHPLEHRRGESFGL